MTQRTSPRPPALLRSWLKFLVTLTLLTLTLRLLGSAWLVPDGLWPRAWWWGLRFDLAIAALPEPSSWALGLVGLALGMGRRAWRRQN